MDAMLLNVVDLFIFLGFSEPFTWRASLLLLFVSLMVLGLFIHKDDGIWFALICGVISGLIVFFWPETVFAEVGFVSSLGIAPTVQFLALVLFVCLLIFLISLIHGGTFNDSPIYKFKIFLSFSLLFVYGAGWVVIYSCFLYDPIVDEISMALRRESKKYFQIDKHSENTVILEDVSLEKVNNEMINQNLSYQKPLAGMMSGLLPEFDYQLAKPQPILKLRKPEFVEEYEPQYIKKNKQFQLLLSLIDKLKHRRYIQDRSKEIRKNLVPILNNISKGGAIDYKNVIDGNTALHYSAAIGDVQITQWLVNNGASCNITNDDNKTPLECIGANHSKEIRIILASRTNVSLSKSVVDFEDDKKKKLYADLIRATKRGDVETINSLIKAGADVNAKSDTGATALMEVSASGNVEAVKALIAAGADVNKMDMYGETALMIASRRGHSNVVKALLHAQADVNLRNKKGRTALMLASLFGEEQVVKALIQAGSDLYIKDEDGNTALSLAPRTDVEYILKHAMNEKKKKADTEQYQQRNENVFMQSENKNFALLQACAEGKSNEVRTLIKAGANVNSEHGNGLTPLMIAAAEGHEDVVKALIQAGARVNKRWISNKNPYLTALMFASRAGHAGVVKILIQSGADVNEHDGNWNTALWYAKESGHQNIVELLKNADDIKNGKREDKIEDRSDLDPMIRRLERLKCKEAISELYQKRLLTLLPMIRNGADVDIVLPETKGNTALHYSCGLGSLSITRWLLEHGANPNAKTNKGVVPMECVADDNRTAIIQLLKKHGAR